MEITVMEKNSNGHIYIIISTNILFFVCASIWLYMCYPETLKILRLRCSNRSIALKIFNELYSRDLIKAFL